MIVWGCFWPKNKERGKKPVKSTNDFLKVKKGGEYC